MQNFGICNLTNPFKKNEINIRVILDSIIIIAATYRPDLNRKVIRYFASHLRAGRIHSFVIFFHLYYIIYYEIDNF